MILHAGNALPCIEHKERDMGSRLVRAVTQTIGGRTGVAGPRVVTSLGFKPVIGLRGRVGSTRSIIAGIGNKSTFWERCSPPGTI